MQHARRVNRVSQRKNLGIRSLRQAAAVLVLLVAAAPALAQTFERVANDRTPVPGSSATFESFSDARVLDGERVVFHAFDSVGGEGIYLYENGALSVLVDNDSIVPGTSDRFERFFDVATSDTKVVFTASWGLSRGLGSSFEGAFSTTVNGGSIEEIASSVSLPQGQFQSAAVAGDLVVLTASVDPPTESRTRHESLLLSRRPGHVVTALTLDTPRPDGDTFRGYRSELTIRNGQLLFAEGARQFGDIATGIFTIGSRATGPVLVADRTTRAPRELGNDFEGFASFDSDGEEIAFAGRVSTFRFGLYAGTSPNDLRAIVAPFRTRIFEGGPRFTSVHRSMSYREGVVVFGGDWDVDDTGEIRGEGVFAAEKGDVIRALVKQGDIVDGNWVWRADCQPQGNGERTALLRMDFSRRLQDTQEGLYIVEW